MNLSDSYFEDEVRAGFFVPGEIKRAWAAELEVLSEIDRICKKHHIQYFADWGTLLAAVRHEGFIPWDDDLDIVMKRDDYRRFMEIAQTELPEGFSAYNFKNHDSFWLFLGRVVGKRRICFEEEHLEHFHQFPYIAGVDIFVLDYVSRDREAEQRRDELALHTIALADMVGDGNIRSEVLEQELRKLEQICDIQIPREKSGIELKRGLYGVVEQLFAWFSGEEADELTQLFPFGLKPDGFRIPKECYEQAIELPYENTRIPVPIRYCEMLKSKYKDYMRLVRDAGAHDYPFFETQKKQLQSVLDFKMPAYQFGRDQLVHETADGGYRQLSGKKQCELVRLAGELSQTAGKQPQDQGEAGESEILLLLQNMQQTAIDMGTLIESARGEGTQTVKRLEELCEQIYECSVALGQAQDFFTVTGQLQHKIEELDQTLRAEITGRREVVFLIEKARHWKYIEWYWKKVMGQPDTDVYIVPVPYFYKKYDGMCYGSADESEEIRGCVDHEVRCLKDREKMAQIRIVDHREFDCRLHEPDEIVIQNPYDEWNQVMTLPEEYYSCNLQKYTQHLVYIVPFRVEEFSRGQEREYHNMQYYCTMPGVVRADTVYVQSMQMRVVYIQKLTEFAGKDTREIWEKKLVVAECTDTGAAKCRCGRKKIAFFVQVGLIVQYREKMLEKLRSVLAIFRENREKAELIWIGDREHDAFLRAYDSAFADWYEAIAEAFKKEDQGRYLDRSEASVEEVVAMCDAYYGSAGHIALEFELKKKPVMIMDVEVL